MHDPSDLESAIERSLESRSAGLDDSSGNLDDVLTRVERRRSRRRSIAMVGSVAAAGVGLIGIVALADRRDATPASSPGSETSAAADEALTAQPAWRCDDQLAYWGESGEDVYFASCEQTTIDGSVAVIDGPPPTTGSEPTTTTTVVSTGIIGAPPSIPLTTLPPDDPLVTGEQLYIEQLYVVIAGDSLIEIARMFGVDLDVLVAYNEWPEGDGHPIYPGDEVRVPPGAFVPDGLDDRGSTGPTSTTTTSTTIG